MSNKLKNKSRQKGMWGIPVNPSTMPLSEISKQTGARIETLKAYLQAKEDGIRKAFEEEYSAKLYKSQDYLAINHVLVTYLALRKAYGYTKAFGKYLDVINEAQEEINRRGVKDVYQEMKRVTGREFYFDSEDLNKEFGLGENE